LWVWKNFLHHRRRRRLSIRVNNKICFQELIANSLFFCVLNEGRLTYLLTYLLAYTTAAAAAAVQ